MSSQIDIEKLSTFLKSKRGNRGLRTVAEEIGDMTASTLLRIEQGQVPNLEAFMSICDWLGVQPQQFINSAKHTNDNTPDIVAAHLRADKTLAPETADALVKMIHLAYVAARGGDLGKGKTKQRG